MLEMGDEDDGSDDVMTMKTTYFGGGGDCLFSGEGAVKGDNGLRHVSIRWLLKGATVMNQHLRTSLAIQSSDSQPLCHDTFGPNDSLQTMYL